jgi:hypothetical protein
MLCIACFYGHYQLLLDSAFIVASISYYRKSNLTFNGLLSGKREEKDAKREIERSKITAVINCKSIMP